MQIPPFSFYREASPPLGSRSQVETGEELLYHRCTVLMSFFASVKEARPEVAKMLENVGNGRRVLPLL
jgi:hypothetical protein